MNFETLIYNNVFVFMTNKTNRIVWILILNHKTLPSHSKTKNYREIFSYPISIMRKNPFGSFDILVWYSRMQSVVQHLECVCTTMG